MCNQQENLLSIFIVKHNPEIGCNLVRITRGMEKFKEGGKNFRIMITVAVNSLTSPHIVISNKIMQLLMNS